MTGNIGARTSSGAALVWIVAIQFGMTAAPAGAQIPFTLADCMGARNDDATVYYCSQFASGTSGTEEDKTTAAIRASRVLRERGDYATALDLLAARRSSAALDEEIGHIHFETGDHLMADFHYEAAAGAGLDPDVPTLSRMVMAAHWYGEELLYSDENPSAAIDAYGRALNLDPDHLPSLLGRAEAHASLAQHGEALRDLDRAIGLGADWSGSLLRARSRRALGDTAGAIVDFRRVLSDNPDHVGAREALKELDALP